MNTFKYDKQRHLELLKLKSSQDTILTHLEKSELKEYACILESAINWEVKEQYLQMLENLISGKISSLQFYNKFMKRTELTNNAYDSLIANFVLLSPHEKSEGFSQFLVDIISSCVAYENIFDLDISEEERNSYNLNLRNEMEETYLEIQEFLKEG